MEREPDRKTTEEVIEETGVGDPLSERQPVERPSERPARDIEPEDATPEPGVETPRPAGPDRTHVVEETGREED